jgi:hypothetical protein
VNQPNLSFFNLVTDFGFRHTTPGLRINSMTGQPPQPKDIDSVLGNNNMVRQTNLAETTTAHGYYFNFISACTPLNTATPIGLNSLPIRITELPPGIDVNSVEWINGTNSN